MQIKTCFIFFLLFTSCCLCKLNAQGIYTAEERNFFEKQKFEYARWLENNNLSELLTIHSLRIAEDSLVLFLDIVYEDLDSAVTAWKNTKQTFDSLHLKSLEEELFYYFVHLMEVEPEECSIEIFTAYNYDQGTPAYLGIYFANGSLQLIDDLLKSSIRKIKLSLISLKNLQNTALKIQRQDTQSILFQKIIKFAKSYFKNKEGSLSIQEGDLPRDERLRFRVKDLRREVLVDETNPLLARILSSLGRETNWVKREMLVFHINYDVRKQVLEMVINGKYGSGVWKPRISGYMEMEPEFKDYLEDYADRFVKELKKYLAP